MTDLDLPSRGAPIGGVSYAINDLSGWEPDAVPAAWSSISTIPGPGHSHGVAEPELEVLDVESDEDGVWVKVGSRLRTSTWRHRAGVRRVGPAPLPSRPSRGLALKALTLHEAHQFFLKRLWNRVFKKTATANIFFVSIAVDGSGTGPFVWPLSQDTASQAAVKVKVGQTYKWTLGDGAPIYGPRVIEGGLAVSILVVNSRDAVKNWGKILSTISGSLSTRPDLVSSITSLAHPAAFTAEAALEAVGKAAGAVGDVLQVSQDKRVGAYIGLFSATGSWEGKLVQKQSGASIRLAEVRG